MPQPKELKPREGNVRARLKIPEHIPDWAKCCPRPLLISGNDAVLAVDMTRQSLRQEKQCAYCEAPFPDYLSVWVKTPDGAEGLVPFELLDIDEGIGEIA